jgi:hypothetical protein
MKVRAPQSPTNSTFHPESSIWDSHFFPIKVGFQLRKKKKEVFFWAFPSWNTFFHINAVLNPRTFCVRNNWHPGEEIQKIFWGYMLMGSGLKQANIEIKSLWLCFTTRWREFELGLPCSTQCIFWKSPPTTSQSFANSVQVNKNGLVSVTIWRVRNQNIRSFLPCSINVGASKTNLESVEDVEVKVPLLIVFSDSLLFDLHLFSDSWVLILPWD